MNTKQHASIAAYYVDKAIAEQHEIHSQWFYFNQSTEQPARIGNELLERHDWLDSAIRGLREFMLSITHEEARVATSKQVRKFNERFVCKLSDLVFTSCRSNEDSSSDIITAREYIDQQIRPTRQPTLSLLEDNVA